MSASESKLALCDICHTVFRNTSICRLGKLATETGSLGDRTLRRSTRLAAKRINPLLPRYSSYDVLSDYRHHDTTPDFPNLRISAEAGCDFCRFVRDAIISSHGASLDRTVLPVWLEFRLYIDADPFHAGKSKSMAMLLVLSVLELVPGGPELKEETRINVCGFLWPIGAYPEAGQVASLLRIPRPLSKHVFVDESLRYVEERLQQCVTTCDHKNEQDRFIPRRLLCVPHETLRIVEFDNEYDVQPDARYVTLSYCWGDAVQAASQVKFTEQNAARYKSGFSIEELSPIQKDAVHATRILGVPFIWIDALCIRQDSRSDWERESSVMDMIYAASYLTICTLTSASCQEGFLQRPEYPRRIEIPVDPSRDDSECFEIGSAAVCDSNPMWAESDIVNNRWSTRGWTFQEKLLATRILYFGNTGLHFACSARLCSEFCGLEEEPRDLVLDAILKIQDPKDICRSWYQDVAQSFSARQLTYVGDTLPALSGLARRFAKATGDRYLAGLWESDLVHGLLWVLLVPEHDSLSRLVESLEDEQTQVGPSWTWGGRGELGPFLRGKRDVLSRIQSLQVNQLQCKILRASTNPNGQDSFGAVSGGVLIVEAYICPLGEGEYTWKADSSRVRSHLGRRANYGDFCIQKRNEKGLFFSCNLDWIPSEEEQWAGELIMALIGSFEESGSHSGSSLSRPYGLLLHKTGVTDQYVRVGVFGPLSRETEEQQLLDIRFFYEFESRVITIV